MINQRLLENFHKNLRDNKNEFYQETLHFFELANINAIYKPLLFNSLTIGGDNFYNYESAIKKITALFESETNPENDSGIVFRFPKSFTYIFGGYNENSFIEMEKVEKKSYDEFWQSTENIKEFKSIQPINAFFEITVKEDEVRNIKIKYNHQLLDIKNWTEYFKKILEHFYPEFKFEKSLSDDIARFIKPIDDTYYLGLEFDLKEIKYQFRRGVLDPPLIYVTIIDRNNIKKVKNKIDTTSYKNMGFYDNQFLDFIHNLSYMQITTRGVHFNTEIMDLQVEKLENGLCRMYHNPLFGELLVKYYFYYSKIKSEVNLSYLNYLEANLLKALKNEN